MRVLILGDSPLLTTGFGRVNAIAAKRFQEEGWDVASVAGLTTEPPEDDRGIKIFVPSTKGDMIGARDIIPVTQEWKPDILYMTSDPGTLAALAYVSPDMPVLAYVPIEGAPILHKDWITVLSQIPLLTVSKFGTDVLRNHTGREVDYVYHGVDHDTFQVTGIRDEMRAAIGWTDKFVINCTSTNVGRKQLPRLIEALSILKYKYKQDDIILYLHTVPFQGHWLDGWNLIDIGKMYGVNEQVFYHPKMVSRNASVDERTNTVTNPGLVEMYNASDLFVLPSRVEGFGLPIAEAMACGVPVLVTKYAAGWEVAQPAGRGIPVNDWEVHKSGTLYANVSPELMAKEILRLKRNPKERARMSAAGLERVKDFDWNVFRDRLIPAMKEAYDAHEPSDPQKEEEDSGEHEAV